jgi:FtsH-binding integral membrane protein
MAINRSRSVQYSGLGLYVVAEAIIFLPLIYFAMHSRLGPGVLIDAGLMTGLLFAGLTFTAVTSRRDFSFLRAYLSIGGFIALGLIIGATCFGFSLGLFFSGAMVLLASGAILYDTSNILRTYPSDQYVGASLQLFASVALLFWYILRIFMDSRR